MRVGDPYKGRPVAWKGLSILLMVLDSDIAGNYLRENMFSKNPDFTCGKIPPQQISVLMIHGREFLILDHEHYGLCCWKVPVCMNYTSAINNFCHVDERSWHKKDPVFTTYNRRVTLQTREKVSVFMSYKSVNFVNSAARDDESSCHWIIPVFRESTGRTGLSWSWEDWGFCCELFQMLSLFIYRLAIFICRLRV